MGPDKRTDNSAKAAISEALKDRVEVHAGNARQVKEVAFKRVRKAFSSMFRAFGATSPTQNEMKLDADLFAIKRKLGKSFFTKKRTPSRQSRLLTLTQDEIKLARAKGWV